MNDEDKSTVYDNLTNVSFYSMTKNKGLKTARMRDALFNLPKETANFRNSTLPTIENVSDDLQGEGVKIFIPFNLVDIYPRLEILLGLRLNGHSDNLTRSY